MGKREKALALLSISVRPARTSFRVPNGYGPSGRLRSLKKVLFSLPRTPSLFSQNFLLGNWSGVEMALGNGQFSGSLPLPSVRRGVMREEKGVRRPRPNVRP